MKLIRVVWLKFALPSFAFSLLWVLDHTSIWLAYCIKVDFLLNAVQGTKFGCKIMPIKEMQENWNYEITNLMFPAFPFSKFVKYIISFRRFLANLSNYG